MSKINPKLRNTKNKKTKSIIIIVCEGEKTEYNYFNHFITRDNLLNIKIVKGVKGNYPDLITKAIEEKEKIKYNRIGVEIKIWCVSDVDLDTETDYVKSTKNQQLKDYKKAADENGFKIALSNPCFELWFLLHFDYTTRNMKDYNAIVKHKKYKENLPNYRKNRDIYNLLVKHQATAIDNAKKLKQFHEDNKISDFMDVDTTPYTNVWELVGLLTNQKEPCLV